MKREKNTDRKETANIESNAIVERWFFFIAFVLFIAWKILWTMSIFWGISHSIIQLLLLNSLFCLIPKWLSFISNAHARPNCIVCQNYARPLSSQQDFFPNLWHEHFKSNHMHSMHIPLEYILNGSTVSFFYFFIFFIFYTITAIVIFEQCVNCIAQ